MRYDQLSPVPPLTRLTKSVIVACVVLFFTDFLFRNLNVHFGGLKLDDILGLVPYRVKTDYWVWQFLTYMFMHGSPLHLLLNMLILWYFGAEIEMRLGEKGFTTYFFLCGIGAGVFNFLVNLLLVDAEVLTPARLGVPIIGSSGAIYGILVAYAIFFPTRIFLVFFVFPMQAKYFVMVMAALELMLSMEASPQDNVAHLAHLGGMGVGALYMYFRYIRPSRSGGGTGKRDAEREKLKRQFTLIVNQKDGKGGGGNDDQDRGPFWN